MKLLTNLKKLVLIQFLKKNYNLFLNGWVRYKPAPMANDLGDDKDGEEPTGK